MLGYLEETEAGAIFWQSHSVTPIIIEYLLYAQREPWEHRMHNTDSDSCPGGGPSSWEPEKIRRV